MLLRNAVFLLSIMAVASGYARAEVITYQPGMIVNLGESFDPFEPFESGGLGDCFNIDLRASTPVAQEKYTEGFVSTFNEFTQKTGLSLSTSGSGSFGLAKISASATYKKEREIFNSEKSVVYVVSGTRTYNPQRVKKITLTTEGKDLLDQANTANDSKLFYRPCGRGLVTSVVKETNISVAYIFTASDARKTEAISSAISAAVSSPKASGGASTNITKSVKQVDSSVTVDVRIFQSGTLDKSDSLKSIIGIEPGDISSVRDNLKKAIMAISWGSSQIKSFNVDKISRHFDIEKDPKFRYISSIYNGLDKAKKNADNLVRRYIQLDDVLSSNGVAGFKIKDTEVASIKRERDEIEHKLRQLVDKTRACFEEEKDSCEMEIIDVSSKILDKLVIDFGGFNQWKASASGGYNNHSERIESNADFWPVFSIRNIKYINRFELIRNGNSVVALYENGELGNRVNNSILEISDLKFNAKDSQYCWRGRWGEDCNPWAADTSRHKNHLKTKFGNTTFAAVIVDIEGNRININVPQISSQSY